MCFFQSAEVVEEDDDDDGDDNDTIDPINHCDEYDYCEPGVCINILDGSYYCNCTGTDTVQSNDGFGCRK